jgi:endonuclease YncB( thermonuclease family)
MKTELSNDPTFRRMLAVSVLILTMLGLSPSALAERQLVGLDVNEMGEHLIVGGEPIRLHGISFPVEDGICGSGHNACRVLAMTLLENWIEHSERVQCEVLMTLSNGVNLGRCQYDGEELAAHLVQGGWAVADRRASRRYVRDEHQARRAQRGLWSHSVVQLARLEP